MEMTFGNGTILVASIVRKEDGKISRYGILLKQMDKTYPINSVCKDEILVNYQPTEKDIVLWFDNLRATRVFQDRVNLTCLALNGYEIFQESNKIIGGTDDN